jgi:hypothetical protein
MKMRNDSVRSRWLVLGRLDDLGRHYEAEVPTRAGKRIADQQPDLMARRSAQT